MGDGFVGNVSARFVGRYQWTVNFDIAEDAETFGEAKLQLKFGPTAWFANEEDRNWQHTVDRQTVDYSHIFLTRAKSREIRQSAVTLREVLDGLSRDDRRLHDELVDLLTRTD